MLSNTFHLIITNVPYLVFNKQSEFLHNFCSNHYPESDNDLATVFISMCIKLLNSKGSLAVVSPQNWLYQTRYKSFRRQLLNTGSINLISRLGSGAFEVITGEVVKVTLVLLTKPRTSPTKILIKNMDVSYAKKISSKKEELKSSSIRETVAYDYLKSKDHRIISLEINDDKTLDCYANIAHGQSAGDNLLFNRFFWEIQQYGQNWELYQIDPDLPVAYSGKSQIIMWEDEKGTMFRLAESVKHLNGVTRKYIRAFTR